MRKESLTKLPQRAFPSDLSLGIPFPSDMSLGKGPTIRQGKGRFFRLRRLKSTIDEQFFWVDEFVVPTNARFSWFSGSNIVKDRAHAPSEYNVEHVNTLIAQASPFLRFLEEFLCWVGISRNYLLNIDTYPRFEYENGEEMDLNAFIRTADPRKVRIVERARAENERPIVTVAKHRTVTLLPTSVVRSSGELSASVEREFAGDASVGDGGDQGFDSVGGQDDVEPTVPVTEPVGTEIPRPKRSKKKRVTRESERMPAASHPPKRLRADYGTMVVRMEGVLALPTLPFITSSVTASPLEEGEDCTDSVTGPSLRTIGPSASAPHPSVFGSSSSSEKTGRTLSLFTGRSGSGFDAGSIRAEEAIGASSEDIYVPEWTYVQWFSTRNLSLSSELRMRAEYNILEKRKWRSLAEEKDILLEAKDKEL
ncbi:hypothetical protein Tco_0496662 [Tanacetum coccineum]